MKIKTLVLAIILIATGTSLTNCKDTSKEEKIAHKDTTLEKEIETTLKADWEKFKKDSEAIIENTEKELDELGKKIAESSKDEREILQKNLDELKQKNIMLKDKLVQRSKKFKENLIDFNASAKETELRFEREFKHDSNELKNAIKDFFENNVD